MDLSRKTALDILTAYERDGAYPNLLLKKYLRNTVGDREKRFITALVYGVIEKKLLLDYYISEVSSVRLRKINTVVLALLRMGLYQIMFLSTPVSAACNSSVELAKTNGQMKSAGFVNAVLRKLSVSYKDISLPSDRTSYLSVKYSVLPDIVEILIKSLGDEETERFLASNDIELKNIYVAVNTLKVTDDGLIKIFESEDIKAQKTEYSGLLRTDCGFDVENNLAYKSGLFHIIGKASYIAAKLSSLRPDDTAYDMCAAPGGKTFVMGYSALDKAHITAFDLHKHKTDIIAKNAARLGFKNINAVAADSSLLNERLIGTADRILCDVPCSGLGMIHKKPDIKYKKTDYKSLIETQRRILYNASLYLKSGGRIVYSTCTVNTDENNGVITDFLSDNPHFEIDKSVNIYNNIYGDKLFLPHADNTDGFYIAVLRKK